MTRLAASLAVLENGQVAHCILMMAVLLSHHEAKAVLTLVNRAPGSRRRSRTSKAFA